MFNLMSNCCSWISKLQEPVRQVTLLVVGLDNAGKTSTVNGILKEPPGDNAPTVGMVRTALKVDQFEVLLVELGGGVQARGLWKQHCGEAHGIVFVVDSSDTQRIKEARDLLTDMLRHPKVSRKPLLVLANKQDKASALLESELIEVLSLERLVNESRTLCHIEPCSAIADVWRWSDRNRLKGVRWLLRTVTLDYSELCVRVTRDTAQPAGWEEKACSRKGQRGRSKPKDDGVQGSQTELPKTDNSQQWGYKPLPNGKLQPIDNIIKKKENNLKKRLKKKKKVKIEDAEENENEQHENLEGKEPVQDQSWQKEAKASGASGAVLPSNRVGEVLSKNPKKSEEFHEQSDRLSTKESPKKEKLQKKKKKKTTKKKNKINIEETPTHPQPVDLSATFDLYRKAILALKARQEQNQ
ncbi:ADP-ribosylation factor-like protein 13B isoform X2 [Acipenser ruthenus]|nr:ADP-ribosylation factor-like protein 13B isoform X2 [Acipenser ruthenus]